MVDQASGVGTGIWLVAEECASTRLDVFLHRCLPHLSRRELDHTIKQKYFYCDGRVAKKGERLAAGSRVEFAGPASWLSERPAAAPELNIKIIHEDSSVLVLDKPAGLATHGFSARQTGTMANYIAAHWPALLNVGKSRWEPGLVHRLDIETSGLILVAKSQPAFDQLRRQFEQRHIRKSYWALVWGDTAPQGTIDFPLEHDSRDRRRMRVAQSRRSAKSSRSWPAQTAYRKFAGAGGLSLLEVEMATGVMHQIRVHVAALGHPIVGDALYGDPKSEKFGLQRHFLHAQRLEFRHPEDQRVVSFETELPGELRGVLERLGIRI